MNQQNFYIFSYGSNTLFQRIAERVGSVEVVGVHELLGYRLVFNKQSIDGSTKANILTTDDLSDAVWGVLHKITLADKPILDEFEALGKGYDHITFELEVAGMTRTIYAYMATDHHYLAEGRPYGWYLNFVIEGAVENDFPADYIDKLVNFQSKVDTNQKRRQENQGLLLRSNS